MFSIFVLISAICNTAVAQDRPVSEFAEEEGFIVRGEIQKPEVFITINRNNAGKAYELELRESFIPKILESMKKNPL
jgi:hypothetical protein